MTGSAVLMFLTLDIVRLSHFFFTESADLKVFCIIWESDWSERSRKRNIRRRALAITRLQ